MLQVGGWTRRPTGFQLYDSMIVTLFTSHFEKFRVILLNLLYNQKPIQNP